MAFDFKKEYKEFYLPKAKPETVNVPLMNYIAVRGSGDPNEEGGAYKASIGLLYAIAFTIKMSKLENHKIEGYFDYVVPPLEGFWWQKDREGIDYSNKASLQWISVIRLPDFVSRADFEWAATEVAQKKKLDTSLAEYLTLNEGLCVQMLHIGAYDDEPASIAKMEEYIVDKGYEKDVTAKRLHHEIYLSDARKVPAERRRTVIRIPIK